MPARRKPAAVLELVGAFAKNPSRRRATEPRSHKPLGASPGALGGEAASCWRELAEAAPTGVLLASDRFVVEIASRLMARMRESGLKSSETSSLLSILRLLGMTPVDRTRIIAVEQVEEDDLPFGEFADH